VWAVVGGGLAFGFVSFLGPIVTLPAALAAVLLFRKSRWSEWPAQLGLIAGAGLPLLVVAGLQWSAWHHRIAGDNTPNPFYWGGVGLCFLLAGVVAFAFAARRR
jgi:hypothetical protein